MEYVKSEQGQYNTQRLACGNVLAAQLAGTGTGGAAIECTGFQGQKVSIYVSATCRVRWASSSSVTTMATTDGGAAARNETTGATGVANSGSVLVGPGVYDRDVPRVTGAETQIFLIVASVSGTVDVNITQS